jgi:hypothetical protein
MLQVITGKFFTSDELNVTRQRGVLYTNYRLNIFQRIETVSGTLLPTETWSDVATLIYEVDQKLEANRKDGQPDFFVATNIDPLIEDFAAITSFVLGITCTPDLELTRRLTQSERPQLGVHSIPSEYVKRIFDSKVQPTENDEEKMQQFIIDLVGLERRRYEACMRAIRRYVTGLHRISDDLDLAYTLLVASIESLAQEFDEFLPTWKDYDQNKRHAIDKALVGASNEIIQRVQQTILAQEHIALARRFKEFTLGYLQPSFFREEVVGAIRPISKIDLRRALERAYIFRSKYVHTLQKLPTYITMPSFADAENVEGNITLTIHGLARIAKHVITQFVLQNKKVEKEEYDYRSNLPGIVKVRLAESLWIWIRNGFNDKSARRYLSGFLSQLTDVLTKQPDASLTDIREVIKEIEEQIKGFAKPEQRLPMLTLYLLFHVYTPPEYHCPEWRKIVDSYIEDFTHSSIETLLASVLVDKLVTIDIEEFEQIWAKYISQRYKNNSLMFGKVFETAAILVLAEKYRQSGNEAHARELISEAVEIIPGHSELLEFEQHLQDEVPTIVWYEILLPKPDFANSANNTPNKEPAK